MEDREGRVDGQSRERREGGWKERNIEKDCGKVEH